MKISVHQMEPWLIEFQRAPYNLGESGVADQTVGEIFATTGADPCDLMRVSLGNGDTRGSMQLRESIGALYDHADPESVLVTTGTSEALLIYFQMRYRPGANVVVPLPSFQSLYEVPRYLGYEVRFLRLHEREGFRPNLDELEQLVDDRTQTIVVNNPHNPTGVVLTRDEIAGIVRLAERRGVEILADEHYRLIPFQGSEPISSVYGQASRVVAVGSMIKCTGCVGLRLGWLLGARDFVDECRDFKDYTTHTLSPLSDYMGRAVLSHWRPIVDRYRRWILENVASFGRLVEEHAQDLRWTEPEAGVVAFPFLRRSDWSTERFSRLLVERTGVFVLPGEVFEMAGYFRVGFGIPPASFAEAMTRLSGFMKQL